ncbi:outer membrane beta-barrel protein [Ohtaekwangia koreensis]|uniref:Outer membrane protein beta-barrel domain-containing protein n=1 Tax=Ohtaekwangia koreensis TaxID=688867 RepID=A0A1T5J9X8_9BACT|nr:outer membrane beta-barrel protein [Ohtaekwangia koreensis]SKC48189.1 Outer membrane protein beta-barrel domain-containing protein [Ohtaekwangia koreensis]
MKYLLIIISLFTVQALQAQNNYFYLALDVNKPLTNTEWVDGTSARGGRIGYRAFITEGSRLSLGIDANWTSFNTHKPTETFEGKGGAITTDYFNYIYQYGVTVSAQYYFPLGEGERVFPYAGLGVGANNNEYVQYYNIYSNSERKWGFLARPEAGILVKFTRNRGLGAMAAVHYDYSTNKSESYNYDRFSSIGFQIGLIVMNRY